MPYVATRTLACSSGSLTRHHAGTTAPYRLRLRFAISGSNLWIPLTTCRFARAVARDLQGNFLRVSVGRRVGGDGREEQVQERQRADSAAEPVALYVESLCPGNTTCLGTARMVRPGRDRRSRHQVSSASAILRYLGSWVRNLPLLLRSALALGSCVGSWDRSTTAFGIYFGWP
eukprot:2854238-Rhodomonas_salina.3